MFKSKILSFAGETIYSGVDVHKKNWKVNIRTADMELENYNQDPDPASLVKHLKTRYPGAMYKIAYEAGFSGFWACRNFREDGVDCIVVNAADIPSSDKDKKQKNDTVDARKIARELSKNNLQSVYIPTVENQNFRDLVRTRQQMVNDQTRCKNRIRQKLMFNNIKVDEEKEKYWTIAFINALEVYDYKNDWLQQSILSMIDHLKETRKQVLKLTTAVRKLSQSDIFKNKVDLLRSIPGIGLINAMVILTEIMDISRFPTLDQLCNYVGFVPSTHDTGDKKSNNGITQRCNYRLRTALIESCWSLIRKDPAMLMKYSQYCKRMEKNKAIIKIGKHLLSRIKYVLVNNTKYVAGVVA